MVSDAQVRLLRQKRMERKTQEAAAAAAGMSVRTARTWARGPLPSAGKTPRSWRTRPDPFAGVWEQEIVPLLTADDAGVLEATTVLDVVAERHGTRYGPSWRWVAIAFGETFEALVAGLQGALWALGGVPAVLRSDNLSAATHELKRSGGRALTTRFAAVLDHYGMASTRIRPGEAHENGVAEQANHRAKVALAQALVLRGSADFPTLEAYAAFLHAVIDRRCNEPVAAALATERPQLRPLPAAAIPSYTCWQPHVRRWSTIRVGGRTYSVPSRLIGHPVEVRQHPDMVEVYYQGHLVERMPRLHGPTEHRIDYRHVIWSLVRKPGAFARYRYREELFPALTFRRAYDALRVTHGDRADVEYVRILHLAASTLETTVAQALETVLATATPFDYAAVKALAAPEPPHVPALGLPAPDLHLYDRLLTEVRA